MTISAEDLKRLEDLNGFMEGLYGEGAVFMRERLLWALKKVLFGNPSNKELSAPYVLEDVWDDEDGELLYAALDPLRSEAFEAFTAYVDRAPSWETYYVNYWCAESICNADDPWNELTKEQVISLLPNWLGGASEEIAENIMEEYPGTDESNGSVFLLFCNKRLGRLAKVLRDENADGELRALEELVERLMSQFYFGKAFWLDDRLVCRAFVPAYEDLYAYGGAFELPGNQAIVLPALIDEAAEEIENKLYGTALTDARGKEGA